MCVLFEKRPSSGTKTKVVVFQVRACGSVRLAMGPFGMAEKVVQLHKSPIYQCGQGTILDCFRFTPLQSQGNQIRDALFLRIGHVRELD
jgi:hypothetical protein